MFPGGGFDAASGLGEDQLEAQQQLAVLGRDGLDGVAVVPLGLVRDAEGFRVGISLDERDRHDLAVVVDHDGRASEWVLSQESLRHRGSAAATADPHFRNVSDDPHHRLPRGAVALACR